MPSSIQQNDGVFAVPVQGPDRGYVRQFLSGPAAAEICGPEFTPSNETFFCAIQHPGEGSRISQPSSTWPDGPGSVARPAVIAVVRADGKEVGI